MIETVGIENILATACFGLAVLHTFLVKKFQHLASKFPSGSVLENLFHLLGEIEVVFGIWSGIYLLLLGITKGSQNALHYLEDRNFTEPAFVFVIMVVCASKPLLILAGKTIDLVAKLLPLNKSISFFVATLILGPLLGSFITEPAAMTVTALLLLERLYSQSISTRLKYATIGLLFVNVSIGGTLTPYAAPPVLMVASKWNWDISFMLANFGWKALVAVCASTVLTAFVFRRELAQIPITKIKTEMIPSWIILVHLIMLFLIVLYSHYISAFILLFLFFLGLANVTKEYQDELKIKEGLLVSFFLGGLIILGAPQRWWLEPLLGSMSSSMLYLGAIGLTAFTDNAALTYLGSQVPTITEASKYALVAGSVVGGGLTIIANAPNPAGYGILNSCFGDEGISPFRLFLAALVPTIIAAICFYF